MAQSFASSKNVKYRYVDKKRHKTIKNYSKLHTVHCVPVCNTIPYCDTHSTNNKKEPGGVEDNKRTIMDTNNIDNDDDHQQVQQEQQAAAFAAVADQRHSTIMFVLNRKKKFTLRHRKQIDELVETFLEALEQDLSLIHI